MCGSPPFKKDPDSNGHCPNSTYFPLKLAEPAWLRDSFPRKETECGLVEMVI